MPDGKLRGKVKWYNNARGFGVICGEDNQEYFIHHTNLPEDLNSLREDMLISFRFRSRPRNMRGMEAYDLKVLLEINSEIPKIEPSRTNLDIQNELRASPKEENNVIKLDPERNTLAEPVTGQLTEISLNKEPIIEHDPPYKRLLGRMIIDRVKGVIYEGRQNIVAKIQPGEELLLVREPDNIYDKNAIQVQRADGQVVGYIDRDLAADLSKIMDDYKCSIPAVVAEKTGGFGSGTYLGLRIYFTVPRRSEPRNYVHVARSEKPIQIPIIPITNSNRTMNMQAMPKGSYELRNPKGEIISMNWDPESAGYILIWSNLAKSGYELEIPIPQSPTTQELTQT